MKHEIIVNSILEVACCLLEKEESLCQQAYALDSDSFPIEPESDDAVKFCIIGAMRRAMYFLRAPENTCRYAFRKLDNAAYKLYGLSALTVNDEMGFKEIKAIFKEAIKCPG